MNSSQELLEAVLKAHGGLERWNRTEKIQLTWNFYGFVLEFKGYLGTRQPTITINTHGEPSSVMTGLDGNPEDRWIFKAQHNSIESQHGAVIQERSEPRSSFKGHTRPTPWDKLHLLYFTSYAHYNYLTTPFIFALPEFEVSELESHAECGEVWRVLEVTHPDGFPTHTKVQRFYFDSKDFLLRRIDYETDVVGGVTSHYCFDYKTFDGIVIPTMRRVVRRLPDRTAVLMGPTSFGLQYIELKVIDKDGSVHSEGKRVV
jgi:hypothetical protein